MAKKKPATQATVDNIAGDTSNPAENKRRQAEIDKQPFCTVVLTDTMAEPPEVEGEGCDAMVMYNGEKVTVDWYVSNVDESILVQHNICIGRASQKFRKYFAKNVEFVHALRDSLPVRGRGCKIAIVQDGVTKAYTWSEFCLEFYGVSADWVRKLIKMYGEMQACPNPVPVEAEPEDEPDEGEDVIEPSPEAIQQQLEEKKDRAERQTDNLLQELANLIGLIERHKDAVPQELLTAAAKAKERTLPPIPILPLPDTDDLLKEIDAVLPKPAGEVPPPPDNQADIGEFPAPTPRRSKKSKSAAAADESNEPPSTTASVKMMITKADEAELGKLGYTPKDIGKMKPEEIGDIINKQTKKSKSTAAGE